MIEKTAEATGTETRCATLGWSESLASLWPVLCV